MKLYELTYLISPELSEEEAKEFSQKTSSLIQEEKGILDVVNPVIRKKQNQFYITTLNFRFEPGNLKTFQKKLDAEKQILRYMILNKPKISSKTKEARTKPIIKPIPLIGKGGTEQKKVELKEIEKKLEEILE